MITIEYLWQQISRYLVSERTILKSSNYSGDADYTKLIIDMIERIGKEINCHVEKEYWPRVDINYFDRETPNNWEEWAREVAIEHENDAGTWTEELDKLFAINAGIKVLIAYSDKSDAELLQDFNRKDLGSVNIIQKKINIFLFSVQ